MRHVLRATLVAALLAGGTGCSAYDRLTTSDFARQEPVEVVEAAVAAMSDLTSLRATGQVLVEGRSVFVDVAVDDRSRCSGTMRTSEGRIALRRVGRATWFSGDAGFFARVRGGATLGPQTLTHLATSWVRLDAPALGRLCDLDSWIGSLTSRPPTAEDLTTVEMVEDDALGEGLRAVHFSPTPDQTVWVSSRAPHHVVHLVRTGRDGGEISFSDFGLPVEVERPSPGEVLGG